jgi:hypothetical protein
VSQYEAFVADVMDQLKKLAVGALKDQLAALQADTKAFLKDSDTKLKKWAQLRIEGDLDEEDVNFLVGSQVALAKMNALTQAGLSAIRLKKLREQITDIVVKAALARFIP